MVMESSPAAVSGDPPDPEARLVAFRDLFDAHMAELYRVVYQRCGDHGLTEDVIQDTFVQAVRSFDDANEIGVGWLVTVARNRLIDILRRSGNEEIKLRLVEGGLARTGDFEGGAVDRLRVQEALRELSLEHRLVLYLRYFDGLSIDELADRLDRSHRGVEALITRARRSLRQALEETE